MENFTPNFHFKKVTTYSEKNIKLEILHEITKLLHKIYFFQQIRKILQKNFANFYFCKVQT